MRLQQYQGVHARRLLWPGQRRLRCPAIPVCIGPEWPSLSLSYQCQHRNPRCASLHPGTHQLAGDGCAQQSIPVRFQSNPWRNIVDRCPVHQPKHGRADHSSRSPFSLGPLSLGAGLAANKTAQVLYVGDAGKIDALKAEESGALTDEIGSPFPGGLSLFLTVDPPNRFLFAADDTPPGNVLAYTIDPVSGALSTVSGSPFATIPGYVGNTVPGAIAVDTTGSFVYTVLAATNQIAAFEIVAPSGVLTPIPGSPFNSGAHPLAMATANNFLYVSNAQDGTISGYTIDPTTGVLAQLAGSPFAIFAGPLAASPFGGFLYTTSSGGLLTLSIDPQTGALTPVGSPVPFGGAQVLIFVQ